MRRIDDETIHVMAAIVSLAITLAAMAVGG